MNFVHNLPTNFFGLRIHEVLVYQYILGLVIAFGPAGHDNASVRFWDWIQVGGCCAIKVIVYIYPITYLAYGFQRLKS